MSELPRLGVNIDHIATLRQLRGTPYPDMLEAARACEVAGARQITVHLREDRRHIQDEDVKRLRAELEIPLNLEMAVADEIVRFAVRQKPDWACLVPEKRREVTTEGGLDLGRNRRKIATTIQKLQKAGVRVSLFIEPSLDAIKLSHELGADAVELHTGRYCLARQGAFGTRSANQASRELERIRKTALLAKKLGMGAHAGHGFDYENVRSVAELKDPNKMPLIEEYNIGHAIVCRAALVGLERAVREMISAISAP
ncbi:MAG: pyridoxine 5'-phosphate synthase [Bdellovibrionales bacterium GWB1_55_8]|nr:MAG: pyridoxine 5'-phosphate synthase [Bdellovibrionales bacterium GWB1_55_8]